MEPKPVTNEHTTELAIDTEAGLEVFAEYIDSLREEIELLQADYFETHQSVADTFYEAGEVYRTLRQLVMAALEEIASTDHVSQTIVAALQNNYDRLIVCRDVLAQALEVSAKIAESISDVSTSSETAPSEIEPGAIASPFFGAVTPATESTQDNSVTRDHKVPKKHSYIAHSRPVRENMFTKKATEAPVLQLLSRSILEHPRYKVVIDAFLGGVDRCESALKQEIENRERPSQLDSLLGIVYKSPFHSFLKDLTTQEIAELVQESRAEMLDRTAALQVEYRVYHEWMKLVPVLKQLVRPHARMTFAELYVRAELEAAWQEFSEQQ